MRHLQGVVEVITGPMFSGKTEELIRRLRRAVIAKQKVQVFKPALDKRYAETAVASHAGSAFEAVPLQDIGEIWDHLRDDTTVVGLDEAQFFSEEVTQVVQDLADRGIRVIIAGLDMDFRGEPFGPMPALLAQADRVDKLQAICVKCGFPATRSQRLIDGKPARYDDPVIIVGASEMYEARCRQHHEVPGRPKA
ncbi:MAG: thymidine kinase [Chloroflexi bacterium]|nr:thymidine kinase [Chloroflexota bacterium]